MRRCGLPLEDLGSYAGDFLELGAVGEATILSAELNDVESGAKTRC
jgi:hypothetical protein